MSQRQAKQLKRAATKASRHALQETPAWTFVDKIIRPKPKLCPPFVWTALLRWLFPGTLPSPTDSGLPSA